jgi:predicted ATP-dependent protease
MATVNEQITDAVTQTNVKTLAESPAMSMSMVYQSMAQAVSLSMQNATLAQQNMANIGQSITTVGAKKIMELLG